LADAPGSTLIAVDDGVMLINCVGVAACAGGAKNIKVAATMRLIAMMR
jgi:hypothetical protein